MVLDVAGSSPGRSPRFFLDTPCVLTAALIGANQRAVERRCRSGAHWARPRLPRWERPGFGGQRPKRGDGSRSTTSAGRRTRGRFTRRGRLPAPTTTNHRQRGTTLTTSAEPQSDFGSYEGPRELTARYLKLGKPQFMTLRGDPSIISRAGPVANDCVNVSLGPSGIGP
jgi:hypothetical protein